MKSLIAEPIYGKEKKKREKRRGEKIKKIKNLVFELL